jgi:hypothetical protein
VFEHGTIGRDAPASELRKDRQLISGSYLGSSDEGTEALAGANGNGHRIHPELLEVVSVKVPADIKRALEERAERDGRPAGAIVLELLEKVKR